MNLTIILPGKKGKPSIKTFRMKIKGESSSSRRGIRSAPEFIHRHRAQQELAEERILDGYGF